MDNKKILVVDDEKEIRDAIQMILEYKYYETLQAADGQEALSILESEKENIALVFLDVKLPGMDGIETLRKIKNEPFHTEVVMISGHATIDVAVKAIQLGAKDFIEKPLDRQRILITCSNILETQELRQENVKLRRKLEQSFQMIGNSTVMKELHKTITKASPANSTVLITGESGSGKELIARAIHSNSSRAACPFIQINCAAIPDDLIENEMFGHEKGAFTGASEKMSGKIELADKGTLFLDEIADMSLKTQAKTLRVIETKEFQRIGGKNINKVDIRIIAATNKNLESEIKKGNFRQDLYFRLNVIPIYCPPLRARMNDIPLLVNHFTNMLVENSGLTPKTFHQLTLEKLMEYSWPGNVRELKNFVERLLIMSPGDVIMPHHLPPEITMHIPSQPGIQNLHVSLKVFRDEMEKQYILQKLKGNRWNISKTAEDLDIQRSNLYKKMELYGIKKEDEI